VSGTQKIIEKIIYSRLTDVKIHKLVDGAIIFETGCSYDRLNFFCFNNLFSIIDIFDNVSPNDAIELHIKRILGYNTIGFDDNIKSILSFRVITSYENNLIHIDEKLLFNIEKYISKATKLKINRGKPDTEYWFLFRSEGFSIFMKRLTLHKSNDKILHKGELQPQLAYMMCWLSQPQNTDIVLDPFCGYGSIPKQRLKCFPVTQFYIFDIKQDAIDITKSNIGKKMIDKCCIKQLDFYTILSMVPEHTIDKVITDPPWGIYEQLNCSIQQFYIDMMQNFNKILKVHGTIVMLTAREDELQKAISNNNEITMTDSIHVLVNGKKASIVCMTKEK
jgi:precorrin-6B methylase 2